MIQPKPHSADLRKGRCSEAGRVYHITTATLDRHPRPPPSTATLDRHPLFAELQLARVAIRVLQEVQAHGLAETLAFVLMPDHLHWLLRLGEGVALSRVVGTAKSLTAHCLGGSVWQPGFYDHALRAEEDLHAAARYIVANPLRAGLVGRVGDYPHWDAVWL